MIEKIHCCLGPITRVNLLESDDGKFFTTRSPSSSRKVVLLSTTPLVVVGGFWNGRNSLSCSLLVYPTSGNLWNFQISWRAVVFYKGKDKYKDFSKGKWPRAARKKIVRPLIEGKAVIATVIKDYKGKWPRAAREKNLRPFIKGKAVIKPFFKELAARSAEIFSNRGPLASSRNCSRSDPETVENRSPLVEV